MPDETPTPAEMPAPGEASTPSPLEELRTAAEQAAADIAKLEERLAAEQRAPAATTQTPEQEPEPEPAPQSPKTPLDELPVGTRIEKKRRGYIVTLPDGRRVNGPTFVEAVSAAFPGLTE